MRTVNGFKIESDIPIPETRGTKMKLPLLELTAGESVFVAKERMSRHSINSAIQYLKRKKLGVFIARQEVDKELGAGNRIWRLNGDL